MKGPGLKIGLDVRQVWQCPACGATARTGGDVTARRCGCTDEGVWMRYVEPSRPARRPLLAVVTPAEPTPADVPGSAADAVPEVPSMPAAEPVSADAFLQEPKALPMPEPPAPQSAAAPADAAARPAPQKSGRRRRPRRGSGGQADKRPA